MAKLKPFEIHYSNPPDSYSVCNFTSYKLMECNNAEAFEDEYIVINKQTLAIGGNNNSIYLIDTIRKQLFSINNISNCGKITCIKSLDIDNIIISCSGESNKSNDVVIYKKKDNNSIVDTIQKLKIQYGI